MLNALLAPLAAAGYPPLSVSSFSSDYIIVRTERLDEALQCLCRPDRFRVVVDEQQPAPPVSDGSESDNVSPPRLSMDSGARATFEVDLQTLQSRTEYIE